MLNMPHVSLNLETLNWDSLLAGTQSGGGVFVGKSRQRGHGMRGRGIGGVLATILRMVPMFFGSTVGQQLLNTGKNIASDVVSGAPVVETVKAHGRSAVRNLTGLGIKRPIAVLKPHNATSARRKRLV